MFDISDVLDVIRAADGEYDDEIHAFVSVRSDNGRLLVTLTDDESGEQAAFLVTVEREGSGG